MRPGSFFSALVVYFPRTTIERASKGLKWGVLGDRQVYLTGVDLTGVYLIGVHLMGGHLMGGHLMGVHLMGVHLMGVHLMAVIS